MVKGAAKARAARAWQEDTEHKLTLKQQIERERHELQVLQAQAMAGGASLDGAQVRAGLTGDIRNVINQVNNSVLHEVDSMMMASGIQRSLDRTKEAVSPIFTRDRDRDEYHDE